MIARFEDGSPAVTVNKFGKGAVIAVISEASAAAQRTPQLTRDVLAYARSLRGESSVVDIVGASEKTDIAVRQTLQGFRVAFVNHDSRDLPIVFRPVNAGTDKHAWIDLTNDRAIEASGKSLKLTIPATGFCVVEFRQKQ